MTPTTDHVVRFRFPFLLALSLASVACGGDVPIERTPGTTTSEKVNELLPLQIGNTWTFRITGGGSVSDKTTVVIEEQLVGGRGPNKDATAFFVRTTKKGSAFEDKTESWQATVEGATPDQLLTVRYREIAYEAMSGAKELEEHWFPYKLRVDNFHTAANGAWVEDYTESKLPADPTDEPTLDAARRDTWSVQADAVAVTVPAGTFMARQVLRESNSQKMYWFVPGVGKVREAGGQTEELVDCVIGGKTCAELAQ